MKKSINFIDTNIFRHIDNQRKYNRHTKKLEQINLEHSKKFDLSDQMEYLDRLNNNKMQAKIRNFKEKLREIEFNNVKLLDRIINISRRDDGKKKGGDFGYMKTLGSKNGQSSGENSPKSLNIGFRKQKWMDIKKQNSKFVSRLTSQKPSSSLRLDKLRLDFQEHEQHKNRIRKMTNEGTPKINMKLLLESSMNSNISFKSAASKNSKKSQPNSLVGKGATKGKKFLNKSISSTEKAKLPKALTKTVAIKVNGDKSNVSIEKPGKTVAKRSVIKRELSVPLMKRLPPQKIIQKLGINKSSLDLNGVTDLRVDAKKAI